MEKHYLYLIINKFLEFPLPENLLDNYLSYDNSLDNNIPDTDDHVYLELMDYISSNLKDDIAWCTASSILEAAELIYNSAIDNGNL